MAKSKYNLICVAHPDDETIFFGGLILSQKRAKKQVPWKIICVTDGNADGQGALRFKQFKAACSKLGVKDAEIWDFPDLYEKRLDIERLTERLRSLSKPEAVFTHGILGEYGHPHHQDVSYAVHQAFGGHEKLYSPAYNAYPEIQVDLSEKEYALKAKILTDIYGSETTRFLNLLPATFTEGYLRLQSKEVSAIYDYLARGKELNPKAMKTYRWMIKYLSQNRSIPRPF